MAKIIAYSFFSLHRFILSVENLQPHGVIAAITEVCMDL